MIKKVERIECLVDCRACCIVYPFIGHSWHAEWKADGDRCIHLKSENRFEADVDSPTFLSRISTKIVEYMPQSQLP
jgi:hypothetical protein